MKDRSSTSNRKMATVLKFISRAEQMRLRGARNYSRCMLLTKGFVDLTAPSGRSGTRSPLRNLFVTASGTVGMVLFSAGVTTSFGSPGPVSSKGFRPATHMG
jgi:hypothetical protein